MAIGQNEFPETVIRLPKIGCAGCRAARTDFGGGFDSMSVGIRMNSGPARVMSDVIERLAESLDHS